MLQPLKRHIGQWLVVAGARSRSSSSSSTAAGQVGAWVGKRSSLLPTLAMEHWHTPSYDCLLQDCTAYCLWAGVPHLVFPGRAAGVFQVPSASSSATLERVCIDGPAFTASSATVLFRGSQATTARAAAQVASGLGGRCVLQKPPGWMMSEQAVSTEPLSGSHVAPPRPGDAWDHNTGAEVTLDAV